MKWTNVLKMYSPTPHMYVLRWGHENSTNNGSHRNFGYKPDTGYLAEYPVWPDTRYTDRLYSYTALYSTLSQKKSSFRGIFHVVSCFPLHFMLYRGNFEEVKGTWIVKFWHPYLLPVVGGCGSAIFYIKTHFVKDTQVLSCFLAKFAKALRLIVFILL